jgi:hypothetical protein
MIPGKNGIYIRKLTTPRLGDIIEIPKFAKGDQDHPEDKSLNCDWIALEFMNGLVKANALDAGTMKKTGHPEWFNINKLLKYSKSPGVKVFLVINLVGSDPAKEAKIFLSRVAKLTDRSSIGGVIVHINGTYKKRSVKSTIQYLETIKSCGLDIGFWGDESVPANLLNEFIKRASFVMGNVTWKLKERPNTGLVNSYLFWDKLNVKNYIPVVTLYSSGAYKFKAKAVDEYFASLLGTDITANMWYCWDPEKKYGGGLESNMDVRYTLFRSVWTREISKTGKGVETTTPDELTIEEKMDILWQDYLDRNNT